VKEIPVLVTVDVHPIRRIGDYLLAALDEMTKTGIRATFFFTASILEKNGDIAERILNEGHQIGSHGLLHNAEPVDGYPPERYDLLEEPDQRRFLEQATARTEAALGRPVTAFRGPSFGISGATIRLLEEQGYAADFSVNSQRLDFFMANPLSCNHLLAPRLPYHPSFESPFRKGGSALWEIPLSSLIVPFAVMTLITFRLTLTKLLFTALRRESKRTGKPIVYMVHPEEFSPKAAAYHIRLGQLRWKHFLPMKGEGIRARRVFRMSDAAKIHRCNQDLLEYMRSSDDVRFVTADEYIGSWLATPGTRVPDPGP
jgi:hypothetical protein